ncbi:unnamed protein product [Musa hybrid cultivar]
MKRSDQTVGPFLWKQVQRVELVITSRRSHPSPSASPDSSPTAHRPPSLLRPVWGLRILN